MANIHSLIDSVTASRHTAEQRTAPTPSVISFALETVAYILPDGTEVAIDATAAKGAPYVSFTLNGGKVVVATRKAQ